MKDTYTNYCGFRLTQEQKALLEVSAANQMISVGTLIRRTLFTKI